MLPARVALLAVRCVALLYNRNSVQQIRSVTVICFVLINPFHTNHPVTPIIVMQLVV